MAAKPILLVDDNRDDEEMANPIRLLLVEDSADDAENLLAELADCGLKVAWDRVDSEADYLANLNPPPDLIVADYWLPQFSGLRALEILAELQLDIPLIVVSGTIGDERAAQLFKLGASDFLLKDRLARLGPAITQALDLHRARIEQRRLEQALRESEEKLRLFIQYAPAAVAMFDRDMRYVAFSQRWLSDYRLSGRDLAGRSHYEIFPDIPNRWKEIHQRCLAGATEMCDEDQFQRADELVDWVHWEVHPWRTSDGDIGGIVIFSEVVTKRKQAEQALREAHARLQALSHRVLEIQEAERQRISRELHDDVAQTLSVELMQLHTAMNHAGAPEMENRLAECIGTVDQALSQVRAICMDLRPPQIDGLGLTDALRAHVQRQGETFGVEIHFAADAMRERLRADLEIACFRMVQEAVSNIGRHARAHNAWIGLRVADGELHLTVRDDGNGFDIAEARERAVRVGRMGLIGMQERAVLAGGSLQIDSAPGRGTEVRAILPLQPVQAGNHTP